MERPFRYQKRLVRIGGSHYLLVPRSDTGTWERFFDTDDVKEVILEIYKDRMVIKPSKKK